MSNISLSKYINFYRRGRNSNNTHFNFTGIKDYTLEKNSNRKKGLKAWKLNTKSYGYLILLSLDNIKSWKKEWTKSTAMGDLLTQ